MKKLNFLPLLFFAIIGTAKEITIQKNADGGWYFKTLSPIITSIQPGDTVVVTSDIAYAYIYGLNGTAAKPIVIRNKGGKWRFGTNGSYGLIMENCHHFILDGTGHQSNPLQYEKYGMVFGRYSGAWIPQTLSLGLSDNYEIKNVEVTGGEVGMFSNYSGNTKLYNIAIHDNWIHRMGTTGNTCEGLYFGNTNNNSITQGGFINISIFNNLFEDLGGDGMQLCCAQNYKVYGNIIRRYGQQNLIYQQTGLLIGGNSFNGLVENNLVENGTGSGMQLLGCGFHLVQNNKFLNTSTAADQDGIYISKRGTDGPTFQVNIFNNIIQGAKRNGIRNENGFGIAKPGRWQGNYVTGTGASKYQTGIDTVIDASVPPVIITPPVTPPPAPTVTQAYHDSVVAAIKADAAERYQVAIDLLNATKNSLEKARADLQAATVTIDQLNAYKAAVEAYKKAEAAFRLLQ